jgi:hypothetical protein
MTQEATSRTATDPRTIGNRREGLRAGFDRSTFSSSICLATLQVILIVLPEDHQKR